MKTFKTNLRSFTVVCLFAFASINLYAQDYKIEQKEVAAIKALVIKADIPMSEIGKKMGELFGQLFTYVGSNNIQIAGAPFAVYYSYDPKGNTVFEVGVPVSTASKDAGDVKYKEFAAMKVASTIYIGPYEKMTPAYTAVENYMKENKLEATGIAWEIYIKDPSTEKDPNNYQTLIYFPVK